MTYLRRCKLCNNVVATLFIITFAVSLFLYYWIPKYIDDEIHRQIKDYIVLTPGHARDSYQRFLNDTGVDGEPHYTKFYFFNITNLEDVRSLGSKPILQELGPYTYRTTTIKHDVAFYYNGSLSYKAATYYFPEASMTNGSFDDKLVTLNLALVGILSRIDMSIQSFLLRIAVAQLLAALENTHTGIFMSRSVDELLWGYDEVLLGLIARWSPIGSRFALMKNGTDEDVGAPSATSMVNTGFYDLDKTGQLEMWNGLRAIENWNNYSEPVQGTAGTYFQPFLKGTEKLRIWVPQMYRSMKMRKTDQTKFLDIDVYRYTIDPEFWAPDERYFGNYRGLVNITSNSAGGTSGPPIYFSPPYFCGADANLSEGVIGCQCNSDDNEFFVDVDPYTGISIRASIRLMISTEFSARFHTIDPNLTTTILPIFHLQENQYASEKETERIRNDLYWALDLKHQLHTLLLVLICVSITLGMMMYLVVFMRFVARYSQENRDIINIHEQGFTPHVKGSYPDIQEPFIPHSSSGLVID